MRGFTAAQTFRDEVIDWSPMPEQGYTDGRSGKIRQCAPSARSLLELLELRAAWNRNNCPAWCFLSYRRSRPAREANER
jgi:hypothetical protein